MYVYMYIHIFIYTIVGALTTARFMQWLTLQQNHWRSLVQPRPAKM